jgi:23S rRNA (cytidine1920-2'-O)/16S rRNA (cytidine1409-2'-O)-methyltransferase
VTPSSRLDVELVRRGLARSRSQAQAQIAAGLVTVNGSPVTRPAEQVAAADELVAVDDGYVSRAAHKLTGALADLQVEVPARALDAGASTGGFTQVLLERGCSRVYAVDVGTGQLAPALAADPRVVVWEQTNLRDLELRHVEDECVDLVVADVSFISLVLLLEPLTAVTRRNGQLLLMVKPQFEVGRTRLGKGGVVRSAEHRRDAVADVVRAAQELGWHAQRAAPSRLPGPAGNVEYFVLFTTDPSDRAVDLRALVEGAPAGPAGTSGQG